MKAKGGSGSRCADRDFYSNYSLSTSVSMEGEVADIKQKSACGKLSSLSLPKNVQVDNVSDSSSDESLVPSLNHLKSAKDIQCQVDSRLRELEECSFSPKGKKQKKIK